MTELKELIASIVAKIAARGEKKESKPLSLYPTEIEYITQMGYKTQTNASKYVEFLILQDMALNAEQRKANVREMTEAMLE